MGMNYKDDYGDVWSTSAVTTYYQTRTTTGSLKIGPAEKTNALVSTPFFMDPDYQGSDKKTINVDSGLKSGSTAQGLGIKSVYTGKKFSYHQSFIGEQVNASIQALPNDVVRYSYVHTVFNYGADQDQVPIYPSMGVPQFKTKLTAKNLKVEKTATATSPYVTGAGVCSPFHTFLKEGEPCANVKNFAEGKSPAVNDKEYRFPYFISSDDATAGPDDLAAKYTNCKKNALPFHYYSRT